MNPTDDEGTAVSKNILKNALICPVCLDDFRGRILLCTTGHNVCENCRLKIVDCPVCRKGFTGTRNFGLEEILGILSNAVITPTVEETEEVTSDVIFGPKNSKNDLFSGPKQGKGRFKCRIIGCTESLPICRLLNHLRTKHTDSLVENDRLQMSGPPREFKTSIDVPTNTSFSKAFQLGSYGLIFYVLNIHPNATNPKQMTVSSWVSIAAPESEAKKIRYHFEMKTANMKATVNDIPHVVRKSNEKILAEKQCLNLDLELQNDGKISVCLKIKQNNGPKKHSAKVNVRYF